MWILRKALDVLKPGKGKSPTPSEVLLDRVVQKAAEGVSEVATRDVGVVIDAKVSQAQADLTTNLEKIAKAEAAEQSHQVKRRAVAQAETEALSRKIRSTIDPEERAVLQAERAAVQAERMVSARKRLDDAKKLMRRLDDNLENPGLTAEVNVDQIKRILPPMLESKPTAPPRNDPRNAQQAEPGV